MQTSINLQSLPLEFCGHRIGEKWVRPASSSSTPLQSLEPNRGKLLVQIKTDRTISGLALQAADDAQQPLQEFSTSEKSDLLQNLRLLLVENHKPIIDLLSLQSGQTPKESEQEFTSALAIIDQASTLLKNIDELCMGRWSLIEKAGEYRSLSVGPALVYLPYSNPLRVFASSISSAILSGSPLIICPSMHVSGLGMLVAQLLEHLTNPKGMFSVVFGDFQQFLLLARDKRIRAVIYTGSRDHCETIRRECSSGGLQRLSLQSGGKNATLVHSSADLDLAVKATLVGSFTQAGQLASSCSQVFVHKTLLSEFCDKLIAAVQSIAIGPTTEKINPNVFHMGPLYSRKAVEKFQRFQTMAHREAEKDLLWGKSIENEGFFVTPGIHLMKSFDKSSALQTNVLFCPDLCVFEYDNLAQAISCINHTDAPHTVCFIGDPEIVRQRRANFVAPNIVCNNASTHSENPNGLTGRWKSGQHPFYGMGLTQLLMRPQLLVV